MDLVLHDLAAGVLKKLDMKAKASGRTIEAEAAAWLRAKRRPIRPKRF